MVAIKLQITYFEMNTKLLYILIGGALLLMPKVNFAQAPILGTAAGFALFSTNGSVSNSGISQVTGNIGTNNGSSTAFGNVNGTMHDQDAASAQCSADLLIAYNQLNNMIPTFFPSSSLGNGDTLVAGVYAIGAPATLNATLYLNAKGNSNAVFVLQIGGAFSTNAGARIALVNGAQACMCFGKLKDW